MSKESKSNSAEKMKGKKYMKELRKLQAELCTLQEWVKDKGLRAIIVFEGRDAAGKGGTIKAIAMVIIGLALVALTKTFGG